MTKIDVLKAMIRELKYRGLITTQKDLADQLGVPPSSVSSAVHGSTKSLTANFLRKINKKFGGIFSETWIETGEGDMLAQDLKGTEINLDLSHHNASNGSTVIDTGGNLALSLKLLQAELAAVKRELEWTKEENARLLKERNRLEVKNDELQASLLEAIKSRLNDR